MAFLTNMLIDGLGEDCSGGESTLNQLLLMIFAQTGGCLPFVRLFLLLDFSFPRPV